MVTWQAILFGVYAPMAALLIFMLWRDGTFSRPRRAQPEETISDRLENIAADLTDFAPHANDIHETPQMLTARLRLLNACRIVLIEVGFDVEMRRPATMVDDENGDAPLAP